MGRIFAWFGGLSIVKKALIVACGLLLFVVISPLIVPIAVLVLLISLAVTAYRMLRRRPFKRPAIFLISSLVALVLASGVSQALYGTSTEQASTENPKQTQAAPEPTTEKTEAKSEKAETTSAKPVKAEKTEQAATSKPKPKPEPAPKPKPKPQPAPTPVPEENDKYDASVTVARVVDGDTVEISPTVDGIDKVRLIGMDTPETVDPGEEVEPFGPEASAFATDALTGQEVELEFDQERIDQYDRLLAYVYTSDGSMFNEDLVEQGYAQAYPFPPNTRYEAEFAAAQDAAATAGLGIWSLTPVDSCLLADRGNGIGEGTPGCVVEVEPAPSPEVEEVPAAPTPGPEPSVPEPAPLPAPSSSAPVPSGADGGYNCSDFSSQAEAQSYMPSGDPDGLDADDDGQACEDSF